jgi:hypothetical protein
MLLMRKLKHFACSKSESKCRFALLAALFVILYVDLIVLYNRNKEIISIHSSPYGEKSREILKILDDEAWQSIRSEYDRLLFSNKARRCSAVPLNLTGSLEIAQEFTSNTSEPYFDPFSDASIESLSYFNTKAIESGGRWQPVECLARHRVAIIIPYKDRLNNLKSFLFHMHAFLQKQELAYQLFLVEQSNNDLFNKGVIMNAGFLEAFRIYNYTVEFNNATGQFNWATKGHQPTEKAFPFDCFIFHDVDLLPEGFYSIA